jgi:hypothetical protein
MLASIESAFVRPWLEAIKNWLQQQTSTHTGLRKTTSDTIG